MNDPTAGMETPEVMPGSASASRRCRIWLPAIALMLLRIGAPSPPVIEAQELAQVIFTPHFSLANPGARSLGLGGAFMALADDATAAFANPAGLVQLARPEVSVEGRHWSYSTPFTVGGNAQGTPTGIGLDTEEGLRTGFSSDEATGVSFLSFVYPRGRWSFALYSHLFLDFDSTAVTQGLFKGSRTRRDRYNDQVTTADSMITSYGFSAALRVTDTLSLGVGAVQYEADVRMTGSVYRWDDPADLLGSPTTFRPENLITTTFMTQKDKDVGLTGGFLWSMTPSWRLGGRFREGPEIGIEGSAIFGPANSLGFPPGTVAEVGGIGSAKYPNTYGLGIAFRSPGGRWTAAFEWDRVTYSELPRSLELDDQTVDDGNEVHLGGEYVFLGSKPLLALRAGAWIDPDHALRATTDDPRTQALLRPVGDKMHYAVGFGMAFSRFQLDGAVDLSELVDTVSLSAIFSF